MILVKNFNEVNFDEIPFKNISISFTKFKGLSIIIWEKQVGSYNNEILYESFIPKSLQNAISEYIEGKCNKF